MCITITYIYIKLWTYIFFPNINFLQGPDYDSSCEYEKALEHARLCRLLHDWETAKQKFRSRSAPSTPARKHPLHYYPLQTNGDLQRHQRPIYTQQYGMANSVVMYDKTRGGHYTELAWQQWWTLSVHFSES